MALVLRPPHAPPPPPTALLPKPAGSWAQGGSTNVVFIYASLLKDGRVLGWSNGYDAEQFGGAGDVWGTAAYWAPGNSSKRVLPGCGMHGRLPGSDKCASSFCSGTVSTATNELLIFGGHRGDGLGTLKRYNHAKRSIETVAMQSHRWYPGAVTLPDGRAMVVGGVTATSAAIYGANPRYNNPTYNIYDPDTRTFGGDQQDMSEQLLHTFPVSSYPVVTVLPTGKLAVLSGNTTYLYKKCGHWRYCKDGRLPDRPHPPWSSPQTGTGLPLPMYPPYNKLELLAAGGTSVDYARTYSTSASDKAHLIELTAGKNAAWRDVGPMPFPRVMGDGVIMCDGTIMLTNGAQAGLAGWCQRAYNYTFTDGRPPFQCKSFCTCGRRFNYEPSLFDPVTRTWSKAGSVAPMKRPRLYHSSAILLPSCQVMTGGSDVTADNTAEIFTPPYFDKGPQPKIRGCPDSLRHGAQFWVSYMSEDPVTKALLIRAGTFTHSTLFDARSLWLRIAGNDRARGRIKLKLPISRAVMPPGMYMLTLNTAKGVPSAARIISICARC
ncbi:kelch motif family [Micractinium conductrix]|uniref:Kelch motif family n=1 Tax=Micractinium conductrix TaxID=554055 RepID=A0A2P6UZE1_9CHLO|nr:kelch motif family [Micractinium conductrix]|eukprot:PSC67206.1 kelch motif family [Micractinium conductrix]